MECDERINKFWQSFLNGVWSVNFYTGKWYVWYQALVMWHVRLMSRSRLLLLYIHKCRTCEMQWTDEHILTRAFHSFFSDITWKVTSEKINEMPYRSMFIILIGISREQSCFQENIHGDLDYTVFWLDILKLFELSNF